MSSSRRWGCASSRAGALRQDDERAVLMNETLARSGFLGPRRAGSTGHGRRASRSVRGGGYRRDVRQYGLDQEPDPQVFVDARQLPPGNPIRRTLRCVSMAIPPATCRVCAKRFARSTRPPSSTTWRRCSRSCRMPCPGRGCSRCWLRRLPSSPRSSPPSASMASPPIR